MTTGDMRSGNELFLYFGIHRYLEMDLGHMVSSYGKATHNTYLQVLCETGIIGSLLFLLPISIILKKLRNCNNVYFISFLCMLLQVAFLDP